jgi:ferredoxin
VIALQTLETPFDKAFGQAWNPVRQAGTLAFFFFWIAALSGIYVYIFFETTVGGAFETVEWMTVDNWYAAGVMRSLHRYASDAMVVATLVHLTREFVLDRFRGARWFSWFTGVPVLWFLYLSGISGYWLVWDQLAQYVAIGSMEWIDALGIFGEPSANNFLMRGSLTDRFFSLLVFTHIFVPLFLLFMMWMHVMRISRPRVNPSRGLALGTLAMLVALSVVYPATSHPKADLGTVPTVLDLDWFFMVLYPVFDAYGPTALWAAALGISGLVAVLPWLPPLKQTKAAEVTLDRCNGCTRCFDDCPYGAITMQPRTDGAPYDQEAVVDTSVCTRCGICAGACPSSTPFRQGAELITGIDLPDQPLADVKARLTEALDAVPGGETPGGGPVVVFGCDHGVGAKGLEVPGACTVILPCIGNLPPSFIDFALSRAGAEGVVLSGCRSGDCYHRFGTEWTEQRLAGLRDPYLRGRVERARLRIAWSDVQDTEDLAREVRAFQDRLKTLDAEGG